MSKTYLESLMKNIIETAKMPRVQVERAVSPILTDFIVEILEVAFKDDDELSGNLSMICQEFPLKKQDNLQAFSLDWLVLNTKRNQLLFVELKTSAPFTKRDRHQNERYRIRKERIKVEGGAFLVEDLAQMKNKKVRHILNEKILPQKNKIAQCRDARIIYLVPRSIELVVQKRYVDKVLTFGILPSVIKGQFADEWKTIHKYLSELDSPPEFANYQTTQSKSNHQPRGYMKFDELIRLCRMHGDNIIISYKGGEKALINSTLPDLKRRQHYKWDDSDNLHHWNTSNWIRGERLLGLLRQYHQLNF